MSKRKRLELFAVVDECNWFKYDSPSKKDAVTNCFADRGERVAHLVEAPTPDVARAERAAVRANAIREAARYVRVGFDNQTIAAELEVLAQLPPSSAIQAIHRVAKRQARAKAKR